MNTTSPKSSLAKLGLHSTKHKTIKVMVLGQSGVGKTAMVVRFVTRRYIGEYDPNLEKIYTCTRMVDNELIQFDILDAAGDPSETELRLESNIRWADAFILMYSINDKSSFDECNRLKFLINYNKRRRKLGSTTKDGISDVPVILVGNKTDQPDRMVSFEEGHRKYKEISCVCFYEVSVRENFKEEVYAVFLDICRFWRVLSKFPKLRRSTSDVQNATEMVVSPDSGASYFSQASVNESDSRRSFLIVDNTEERGEQNEFGDKMGSSSLGNSKTEIETPFRGRASTDGTLLSRPRRWRYPPPGCDLPHSNRVERRMSISARGSNASY